MTELENREHLYQVLSSKLVRKSKREILDKALEYGCISPKNSPSKAEEARLTQILTESQDSELLFFWLEEVDHIIGHLQGDLGSESRKDYRDQAAFLREHLEIESCQNQTPLKSVLKKESNDSMEQTNTPERC